MSTLHASLRAVGAIGPGFDDWPALLARLSTRTAPEATPTVIPALSALPPAERRRVGKVVKLAIATGLQTCAAATVDPATLSSVFASSGGDGDNCHAICETLASDDRLISPTRFHNSVNNAASGYWGIATGAQAPSTIVSAYDGSFAAGLLEAVVQLQAEGLEQILLVSYDAPYPHPLSEARPIVDAMGVGLVLARMPGWNDIARLTMQIEDTTPSTLADARLEHLRTGIPTGRALPLLAGVARILNGGHRQRCVLEHLAGSHLGIDIEAAA
ncbi:beta-ketoacyl synthase chain length factor [Nitrogeniibacter mangrovi]|uniref:Beta-ketoacyl synthase chain length factor n=1 Tax=Nitrogeniibacter mangrovi TaxID=2016596 RepID=A0A6C1B2N3_9RHOO|nr:beta-ketoacyl synthase chain length factor [Nitrogeniibacter mangrovi]QID16464.1 beta-ketoacyl synthase chain length factor [Nitrogeniibacter mangrovi]